MSTHEYFFEPYRIPGCPWLYVQGLRGKQVLLRFPVENTLAEAQAALATAPKWLLAYLHSGFAPIRDYPNSDFGYGDEAHDYYPTHFTPMGEPTLPLTSPEAGEPTRQTAWVDVPELGNFPSTPFYPQPLISASGRAKIHGVRGNLKELPSANFDLRTCEAYLEVGGSAKWVPLDHTIWIQRQELLALRTSWLLSFV
jgi:hypothetical protein